MILIAYGPGVRACELCDLQWSQVDFNAGILRVRRRKTALLDMGSTEDNKETIAEFMRVGLTREQAKDLILEVCGPPPTTKRKTTNR